MDKPINHRYFIAFFLLLLTCSFFSLILFQALPSKKRKLLFWAKTKSAFLIKLKIN